MIDSVTVDCVTALVASMLMWKHNSWWKFVKRFADASGLRLYK